MPQVQISDSDLKQITMVVGSILIKKDNGDPLLYDDNDIKTIAIEPALDFYFTKFPILENYEQTIATDTTVTIPFPDQSTYGLINISVTNRAGISVSGSSQTFWPLWASQQLGYVGGGTGLLSGYGTGKNINGSRHLRQLLKARSDTFSNEATYRYNIDHSSRQVTVYAGFDGNILITWAKQNYNFDSVKFARKRDVIDLARGFLLQHTGNMLSIIPELGSSIEIDAGNMKDLGDKYIEDVKERWSGIAAISMLRT